MLERIESSQGHAGTHHLANDDGTHSRHFAASLTRANRKHHGPISTYANDFPF